MQNIHDGIIFLRLAPLISVIMPCYNGASFIEKAILSVTRQTHSHTEIIVIDDGSSDDSIDIVSTLVASNPGHIFLKNQDHKGPYPARNLGLRYARGEYIAFLDADDWWREDCLNKLKDALINTRADLAYCGWQNVGEHAESQEPYIPPAYETKDPTAAFLKSCPWPIHAALVRRTVLAAVGGFSERYFSSMDYDLWLRILGHTRNMIRVPEVMAFYRWHGTGQISAIRWRQVLDALQVKRDFIAAFPHMVEHLSAESLYELVEGQLLKAAYKAYWSRDLTSAQKLFRAALARRAWRPKDLKYIVPALLPPKLFHGLVSLAADARGMKS